VICHRGLLSYDLKRYINLIIINHYYYYWSKQVMQLLVHAAGNSTIWHYWLITRFNVISCCLGGSVADWLAWCRLRRKRAWVQIAVATLSGNSLKWTVNTHRSSVHQATKLVAALRAWRKVMAAYRRVYDSRHLQTNCQELGSAPEPYAWQWSMSCLFCCCLWPEAVQPSRLVDKSERNAMKS